MSIVLRNYPRVEEFWFDEALPNKSVDVAVLRQRRTCEFGTRTREKFTCVIDLERGEDQIQAAFHSETRYEIRRASSKDNLEFKSPSVPNHFELIKFFDFYNLIK